MVTIESHIAACASDIYDAVASRKYTLDMQIRAYDLLDRLMELKEAGLTVPQSEAEEYHRIYEEHKDRLASLVNEDALKAEAEERLVSYQEEQEAARDNADRAARLHEQAKETFAVWQSSSLFARWKALHRLRKSAGFRLESHRIGNYVAKTYDLMEEARRAHQKSQQATFAANATYKCMQGIHGRIASCLS